MRARGIGVVLWSAAMAVSALAQQGAAAGTAIVSGQVIDATLKQPVAGAVVTLNVPAGAPAAGAAGPAQPSTATTRRAITNTQGRFVFREVPAGTYALSATKYGYSPGAVGRRRPNGPPQTLTIADASRLIDTNISMWRMGAISGVVRDDRGEPAVGVFVTAMRRTLVGGRMELAFSNGEATDDRGHYRISYLEPGSYVVMTRTIPQSVPVTTVERYRTAVASGSAAEIARELREGGGLQMATEGVVIDGWQVSSNDRTALIPGPNGTLLFSPLTFYGGAASGGGATVLTMAPGDDRQGVDFTVPLVTGHRVSGTLTGPAGPMASYGVQVVPAATGSLTYPFPIAYGVTDASGRFSILGVPSGSYTVRALRVPPTGPLFVPAPPGAGAAGRESVTMPPPSTYPAMFAEAMVTVRSSHVDGVALTFAPGARLSGRVVFDGTTAPPTAAQLQRVAVTVRSVFTGDSRATTGQTVVDAAGAFQTTGYAPGRYLVGATAAQPWMLASVRVGGVDASDQAVTLGTMDLTDVVVTFTDKATTLSGSVRAAEAGGDTEATVVAFPADHKAWIASGMTPRRVATAATSPAGTYQLRFGAPGEYLVVAIPPEVAPEVDPEFIAKFAGTATRISVAAGEAKTQALTVSRIR